jgi:hypothetical protein
MKVFFDTSMRAVASAGERRVLMDTRFWYTDCSLDRKPRESIMTVSALLSDLGRVDEPEVAQGYSDVLSQVATERRPVIVRRKGEDLAAVVPLELLELLREVLARQEVEDLAARLDWDRLVKTHRPPQAWFDDDDNPCQPEEGTAP